MVPKWMKNVHIFQKSTGIDLDTIISNILSGNYKEYDWKKLSGKQNMFRVRIGDFRIVFTISEKEIRIIGVDTRGNIYKKI